MFLQLQTWTCLGVLLLTQATHRLDDALNRGPCITECRLAVEEPDLLGVQSCFNTGC